jgi:hypothetical protein
MWTRLCPAGQAQSFVTDRRARAVAGHRGPQSSGAGANCGGKGVNLALLWSQRVPK